jgi:XTP/dITP diphosphohydrolase
MTKLIFATHNNHKFNEVKNLMPATIQLISLNDINLFEEIEETGKTLEENALLKAKTIYNQTGINCFADDSGLLVDALNGAPGVYSARYAGEQKNDENNMQKLLVELHEKPNRNAHFKTAIAIIIDGEENVFEGKIEGTILLEKRGINGFGYDPLFVPNGYSETFAELDLDTKNKISHRAKAMQKMLEFIKSI